MEFYIEVLKNFSLELPIALNKLLKQLDNVAIPLTKADIENMIVSPANRLFIARRKNNKEIVGMLTMIIFRIPYAKKGLLEDIVVDKEYRKKGIGTKLITAALSLARKEGVAYLDFTSRPTRIAANNLYRHLGFNKRDTSVYRIIL